MSKTPARSVKSPASAAKISGTDTRIVELEERHDDVEEIHGSSSLGLCRDGRTAALTSQTAADRRPEHVFERAGKENDQTLDDRRSCRAMMYGISKEISVAALVEHAEEDGGRR